MKAALKPQRVGAARKLLRVVWEEKKYGVITAREAVKLSEAVMELLKLTPEDMEVRS